MSDEDTVDDVNAYIQVFTWRIWVCLCMSLCSHSLSSVNERPLFVHIKYMYIMCAFLFSLFRPLCPHHMYIYILNTKYVHKIRYILYIYLVLRLPIEKETRIRVSAYLSYYSDCPSCFCVLLLLPTLQSFLLAFVQVWMIDRKALLGFATFKP